MFLALLIGVALAGLAAAMVARTIAFDRLRTRSTLDQIDAYGFSAEAPQAEREPVSLRKLAVALATKVGTYAAQSLEDARREEIRGLLRSAGFYRVSPETFLGTRILLSTALPLFWLVLLALSGSLGARSLLAVAMAAALGWVVPKFYVQRRATSRIAAIDKEMPELVDLLVTTVEAGVGFAAALRLVSRKIEGPLGEELRVALREQSMGLTIEEALEHMLSRMSSDSLRAFVQAIVQGQTLGVSIGKILRDLAVDMRKRRRQAAEERAHKLPTKLLFPLIFFILPALFLVVLGGPMITLTRTLSGSL